MAGPIEHCIAVVTICAGVGMAEPCEKVKARVWDGDSLRIGMTSKAEAFRFKGINTAEIKGKCLAERMLALLAKRRLCNLLDGSKVSISRDGTGPYDRTLGKMCRARIESRCIDVGEQMIAEGYAVPWSGRRDDWCSKP